MSRSPVDQVARSRDPQGRQAIWSEIRRLACAGGSDGLTFSELHRALWMPKRTIGSYLQALTAAGVLTRIEGRPLRWVMHVDPGPDAPSLNREGQPTSSGNGTENMWRSMKLLGDFSPLDIAAHSTTDNVQVSEWTAKSYCKMLLATGYLRVTRPAVGGTRAEQARYRLVRNSGPRPPQIQRVKQVWDPNTRTIHRPGEPS